jgi:hypothetical protein
MLEVYKLDAERRWLLLATLKDDDPVSQPPFDAITFPLDSLWPDFDTSCAHGPRKGRYDRDLP